MNSSQATLGMEGLGGTAILSPDGIYRYRLTRRWAPGGRTVLWIMLNPSVATADTDDATIRRCVGFSRRFGAAAIEVVNLFAFRATSPAELLEARDPVGPENLETLRRAGDGAHMAVAAWGDLSRRFWLMAQPSLSVVRGTAGLKCLGRTRKGGPRHPVRLPYLAQLEDWP